MMLIAAAMVPIPPFQPLCDGSCPAPGEWCTPLRVRCSLTIRQGLIRLIGNGINLATSACHSQFRLQLRKEAAMPRKINRDCSSQGYVSSTCDSVEIGGVVADKLVSLFHIPSKIKQFV